MTKSKELNCFDNILDVVDLRSTHSVLIAGEMTLPTFDNTGGITTAKSAKDLDGRIGRLVFDRIFIDCIDLNRAVLKKLAMMNCGLIVVFEENEKTASQIKEVLDSYWHPLNTWILNSKLGRCIVTEAKGKPIEDYYSVMSYQDQIQDERDEMGNRRC